MVGGLKAYEGVVVGEVLCEFYGVVKDDGVEEVGVEVVVVEFVVLYDVFEEFEVEVFVDIGV